MLQLNIVPFLDETGDSLLLELDLVEVIGRDRVVVLLQLGEGFVVVVDEFIDVQILPFLNLVDLHLQFEL